MKAQPGRGSKRAPKRLHGPVPVWRRHRQRPLEDRLYVAAEISPARTRRRTNGGIDRRRLETSVVPLSEGGPSGQKLQHHEREREHVGGGAGEGALSGARANANCSGEAYAGSKKKRGRSPEGPNTPRFAWSLASAPAMPKSRSCIPVSRLTTMLCGATLPWTRPQACEYASASERGVIHSIAAAIVLSGDRRERSSARTTWRVRQIVERRSPTSTIERYRHPLPLGAGHRANVEHAGEGGGRFGDILNRGGRLPQPLHTNGRSLEGSRIGR